MSSERALTPEVIALIEAEVVRPVLFIFADFPSGAVRIWTGIGPITFQGNTYTSAGGVISIEPLTETADTAAKGMVVHVNALQLSYVQKLTNDSYQGRKAVIFLAFWNEAEDTLYTSPGPWWEGFMDTDNGSYDGVSANLSISCEHDLVDILRKREWQYTDADQQALFADESSVVDTGLTRIPKIQDLTIPWGRTQQ